jgi:hypothetical protein
VAKRELGHEEARQRSDSLKAGNQRVVIVGLIAFCSSN